MSVEKIAIGTGKLLRKGSNKLKGFKDVVKEDFKSIKNFAEKNILDDVPVDQMDDSIYYKLYPKKVKKGIVTGGAIALGGMTVANDIRKSNFGKDIEKISGGQLSHMTSSVVSPLTEQLQSGNYDPSRIKHSYRNAGAEGSIVFSMHQLR